MMDKVIESRLSAVLTAHGLTAYKLAKAVGEKYGAEAVKQQTVYALVKGGRVADAKTLNQILNVLHTLTGETIEVGDLYTFTPDPHPAASDPEAGA